MPWQNWSLYPTSTVDVELDSYGVPTYLIHEDVAWDYIPFPDQLTESLKEQSALVFGTLALRNSHSYRSFKENRKFFAF